MCAAFNPARQRQEPEVRRQENRLAARPSPDELKAADSGTNALRAPTWPYSRPTADVASTAVSDGCAWIKVHGNYPHGTGKGPEFARKYSNSCTVRNGAEGETT
jgi:hypothetical protein